MREWLERWFDDLPETEDPAELARAVSAFNQVFKEPIPDGDAELLVLEQQGVWAWGRRDGRFVEREYVDGAPWRELDENAEAFWLHHAAFEAATALPAFRHAHGFTAAEVDRVVEHTEPLPCGAWTWPGDRQTARARGNAVVLVSWSDEGNWVVAAARTEEDLVWADDLGLDWDGADSRA